MQWSTGLEMLSREEHLELEVDRLCGMNAVLQQQLEGVLREVQVRGGGRGGVSGGRGGVGGTRCGALEAGGSVVCCG